MTEEIEQASRDQAALEKRIAELEEKAKAISERHGTSVTSSGQVQAVESKPSRVTRNAGLLPTSQGGVRFDLTLEQLQAA